MHTSIFQFHKGNIFLHFPYTPWTKDISRFVFYQQTAHTKSSQHSQSDLLQRIALHSCTLPTFFFFLFCRYFDSPLVTKNTAATVMRPYYIEVVISIHTTTALLYHVSNLYCTILRHYMPHFVTTHLWRVNTAFTYSYPTCSRNLGKIVCI